MHGVRGLGLGFGLRLGLIELGLGSGLGFGLYDLKVDLKAFAGAATSRASSAPGLEGPRPQLLRVRGRVRVTVGSQSSIMALVV